MKKVKFFLVSLLIVLILNNLGVLVYGYFSLRQSNISLDNGTFSQVMVNENKSIIYEDYTLKNWTSNKLEQNGINEVMIELKDVNCRKLNKSYANFVCYLQSKINSIAEIEIGSIFGDKIDYPISKDYMSKICKSGFSCEIVKLGGKVFFIIRFIDGLEPENLFTTSVYEVELKEEQIHIIESMKQSNELYKRNYPETFTHYYSTPKLIILSIIFIFIEVFMIVYLMGKLSKRHKSKTGDGSMS